jgi:hypothetical protein
MPSWDGPVSRGRAIPNTDTHGCTILIGPGIAAPVAREAPAAAGACNPWPLRILDGTVDGLQLLGLLASL